MLLTLTDVVRHPDTFFFNSFLTCVRTQVLTTDVMSRDGIKQAQVSPDGFLQMSFQLAYYRLYGKTVSTYESASTAAFKHGRTECIRSASLDSQKFTKIFSDPSSSVSWIIGTNRNQQRADKGPTAGQQGTNSGRTRAQQQEGGLWLAVSRARREGIACLGVFWPR